MKTDLALTELATMTAETKTWFITGCDSGMGYAVAQVMLERGDKVVLTARDVTNVQPLLEKFPTSARGFTLDVTDRVHVETVTEEAIGAFGGIDVLLNNAGFGVLGAAEETSAEEYRPMFEVNFFGLAEVTKALLPHMRERRKGHIFNTSSLGGYAASAGFAFYAASKFAVEGFSDALAQEVAPFGIRVVILEPGSFRTHFAGSSLRKPARRIEAYTATPVEVTQSRMAMRDGTQPNDPQRLGHVLHRLARMDALPLRLPLGEDALDRVRSKLEAGRAEFGAWRQVALSVSFDAPILSD